MTRFALVLLAFSAVGIPLNAQPEEEESEPDTSEATDRDPDWLVLPYASYAPKTKIAVGIVGGFYLPSEAGRPGSSMQTSITVTQRRQLTAQISPELYLNEGEWRVDGSVKVTHYPSSFYGIGGDVPARKESYTARYGKLDVTVQRRLLSNLRVGPRVFLRAGSVEDADDGGLIDREQVPGSNGGLTAGLGMSAFWDARNSLYYPNTGSYVELVGTLHSAAWGSDYTFGRLEADLRGYHHVGLGTIAGQVYGEAVIGTAPFELMPLLGGSDRMRGYRKGPFRDDMYWTVQAEYRVPLFWRLKAAAFASVGEVGPRIGSELGEGIEAAVGAGGRLRLTQDGVHGRLDVAYSRTGFELYLSLGEAF